MIYHIALQEQWGEAQQKGVYDFDALATEGFIHCSTADQYMEVAQRIFSGRKDLLLLHIEEGLVTAEIKYENLEGGSELYPHIYGPLNLDAVKDVEPLQVI